MAWHDSWTAMKRKREEAEMPLFALARRSDPPTSVAAAAKTPRFARGHRAAILAALELGPGGQTEIAARAGLTVAQVSKRLHELREAGEIERTGRDVAGGESEYRRRRRVDARPEVGC